MLNSVLSEAVTMLLYESLISNLQKIYQGFVYNNLEAEAQRSCTHALSLSCNSRRHEGNSFGASVSGLLLAKNPYIETTTSSVLSVILLNHGMDYKKNLFLV